MPTYERVDARPTNTSLPVLALPTDDEKAIWSIPSLKAWWEGDAGWSTGLDAVANFRWRDRKNLIEASPRGAQRPNLVANAVNGRGALQFGHGTGLSQTVNNGALESNESGIVGPAGYTFFAVYSVNQAGTGGALIANQRDSGSGAAFMISLLTSDDTMRIYHQTPGQILNLAGGCPTTNAYVTDAFVYDPAADTVTVRRHGAQIGQATGVTTELSSDTGARFLSIGAVGAASIAQAFNGHVALLIAFNAALSPAQIALVEGYLRDTYATW